jgi:salicylate hydroxylase
MHSWNILDQIRAKSKQLEYLAFRAYRNGNILQNHRVNPDSEQTYGFPYLNINRYDLLLILISKVHDLGIPLETGSAVSHLDLAEGVLVTTRGQSFEADLVVGADRERSFVRSILLDEPYKPQATGKLVYRFTVDIEKVRADTSLHDLVEPSAITVWLGPHRHVVAYEIKRGGLMKVAVTCPDPIGGRTIFGPRQADMNEIMEIFSGGGGSTVHQTAWHSDGSEVLGAFAASTRKSQMDRREISQGQPDWRC